MKRDWNKIKWIFEPDGSLRDIYVQDISLAEWEKLIDCLNENFSLTYANTHKIDKAEVLNYLQSTSGELERKFVTINLGGIRINCHFFLPQQIEFDLDPKEVNSLSDFELIETFMKKISETLQEQVTLTAENNPEFPLFKVHTKNSINKILTEKEAEELSGTSNAISNQLTLLWLRLKLKFFRRQFEKRLLESAAEVHRPTTKNKNVW